VAARRRIARVYNLTAPRIAIVVPEVAAAGSAWTTSGRRD